MAVRLVPQEPYHIVGIDTLVPKPIEMLQAKWLRKIKVKLYQDTTYDVRITSVVCRLYPVPE